MTKPSRPLRLSPDEEHGTLEKKATVSYSRKRGSYAWILTLYGPNHRMTFTAEGVILGMGGGVPCFAYNCGALTGRKKGKKGSDGKDRDLKGGPEPAGRQKDGDLGGLLVRVKKKWGKGHMKECH